MGDPACWLEQVCPDCGRVHPRDEETMDHRFVGLLPDGVQGDDVLSLYRDAERPAPADRPWVLANFVAGLDGSIALDGRVGSLTSAADQVVFGLLRELADVVMVGAGTVRAERYGPVSVDDPARERRAARGQEPVPPIAVVTRSLQLDLSGRLFRDPDHRPIIITVERVDEAARRRVEEVADVVVAGETIVEPARALAALADRGMRLVTCEGGPSLITMLLGAGMLDELCLTMTPLVGGDPVRLVSDEPQLPLTRFDLASVVSGGRDELFLRYVSPRQEDDDA